MFGRAHGGYTPDPTGRRTITILAIGSDARPGQNPLASRADSIHVIFLHPRRQQAVVVGIPRDSFVSIPGLGTTKINAAMSSGGPARMVQTVEQNFGARIDYWAVTSFWGITRMVETIGGLQVQVPFRMQDRFSGSNFHKGFQRLRGVEVLAFARDRHSVPGGDFGRQENGGRVIVAALVQFKKEFRREPGPAAHVDRGGRAEHGIQPARGRARGPRVRGERDPVPDVQNVVLPGGTGNVGGLLRGAAVDGDGAGDLRRREGGRGAAPGERPAEPDRRRVSRRAPLIRSVTFRSLATRPR